jgi:hypothetical protein
VLSESWASVSGLCLLGLVRTSYSLSGKGYPVRQSRIIHDMICLDFAAYGGVLEKHHDHITCSTL